jgi:MoaA/NifB/PqqE/SkfB family radical SAM enzyme
MLKRLLYSPFLAQLVVTRRCNLDCGYCNEYDQVSDPVPFQALARRIAKLAELGTLDLELTGGEPMMHPDIFELVALAARTRFHSVMMISNAYLLNEEKVKRLNDAGLTHLQVSVDGVEPTDTTVKVLRPMRKKLEALARSARFKVTLSGVVGSAPPGEVLEVVAFARKHGFRPRVLLLHDHDGQLKLSAEQLAEYRQVRAAIGLRFGEARDYRLRLIQEGSAPFRCRAGSRYLYIDEHGIVRWCSQQREHFGVPLEDYGHDELRRQFRTRKDCSPGCTVGCARTASWIDEWRPQPLQPDPARAMPSDLVQLSRPSGSGPPASNS